MTASKRKLKRQLFWWMNLLIPSALVVALAAFFGDEAVARFAETVFGPNHASFFDRFMSEGLFKAIVVYSRDFLWAYALVFGVSLWYRDSIRGLKKAFLIVFFFELAFEIFRAVTLVGGSFDPGHLISVLLGTALAMTVILVHERNTVKKKRTIPVRAVEVALILILFASGAIMNAFSGAEVRASVSSEIRAAAMPMESLVSEPRK